MNQLLNISNFLGYTAYNNPMRAIRGGEEFGEIIPSPNWQTKIVKRNASVDETVAEMQKVIRKSAWQTKELSKRLLGKDIYTTCGNVWKFLFSHIKYKEDDKGKEQLREPSLSWYLRKIRGIDCDDFSIFAGTILYNLNIPFYLRIARYQGINHFQHVYVIVPKTKKEYITIDAVLDEYDAEKETAETKDFLVMSNNNLNGIEVSVLGGLEDEALNEVAGILSGVDFGMVDELEGLGRDVSEEDLLGAIYNHMVRTRNAVRRYPQIVKTVEDPETFAGMLEYGIKYWNTDKQELALGILEEKEEELNRLNGTAGFADGFEETTVFYGIEGLGGISALGKTKAKKTFFKNVKKAVQTVKQKTQKVKQNVKQKAKAVTQKIKKGIVKNNPVSVAARTGMLVAMKTNLLKIAEKLKWGYLTENEARESGLDIAEWGNAKTQLKKAENLFVNKLKGSAEKFKQAILKGRAGGLKGVTEDLGAVVAATASASLAAAMPFIKQILEFAKGINMKKLIGKIKASKLMQKNKKAETMPEVSDDAPSALPEAAESESTNTESEASNNNESKAEADTKESTEENSETEKPEADTNISKPGSTTTTTNSSGSEEENNAAANTNSEESNTNLPSTTSANKEIAAKESDEPNVMTKVTDWVKENKGFSALIAGGLILAFSSTARKAIGLGKVPRKYKKRKGKRKNNPPKAISGVGKRKRKPKTVKRTKGKKPKQIRL